MHFIEIHLRWVCLKWMRARSFLRLNWSDKPPKLYNICFMRYHCGLRIQILIGYVIRRTCDVSRFNAGEVLEKLRGKQVVFVGDSLSRTQWESMICLLMNCVEDKMSVYEVNENTIIFLVQIGLVPKRAPKRVKSTIKLDELDSISSKWIDFDILVFNTGHWWNRGKLFEMFWEAKCRHLSCTVLTT
ncbi:putative PC-Esterase [Helianthus anomalus]